MSCCYNQLLLVIVATDGVVDGQILFAVELSHFFKSDVDPCNLSCLSTFLESLKVGGCIMNALPPDCCHSLLLEGLVTVDERVKILVAL